jgi:hypothetical protein
VARPGLLSRRACFDIAVLLFLPSCRALDRIHALEVQLAGLRVFNAKVSLVTSTIIP